MNTSIIAAIVVFILVVLFWLFMSYTGFKRMRTSSAEAFRAVTMCYEARRKTAERFVRLMGDFVKDEDAVLQQVTDAVENAASAESPVSIISAEITVADAIMEMLETAKKYEDFTATKRFIKLKDELDLDDRNIATTIKIYNSIAKTYNEKVHGVMTKFAAKLCGFKDIPMI